MNKQNLAKVLNRAVIGLTTFITADSYRRLLNSDKFDKELSKQLLDSNNQLNETIRKSNEIIRELNDKVINNQIAVDEKMKSIEDGLKIIKDTTSNINNSIVLDNNEIIQFDRDAIMNNNKVITQEISKTDKIINDLLDLLKGNSSGNQFISNDFINNIYEYVSSLNFIQLGVITHLLVYICILYCLMDILIVYYSDKLITYYNIETKYPRLGKYIQLRRKFQHYFILINSIFVVLIILYLAYLDLLLLEKIS
jgi:hypothetical protein